MERLVLVDGGGGGLSGVRVERLSGVGRRG